MIIVYSNDNQSIPTINMRRDIVLSKKKKNSFESLILRSDDYPLGHPRWSDLHFKVLNLLLG